MGGEEDFHGKLLITSCRLMRDIMSEKFNSSLGTTLFLFFDHDLIVIFQSTN